MNFKQWLTISEMARSPENFKKHLETNSLQALSENSPDPVLKARYKFLVSEWDGTKNKEELNLTPSDITIGNNSQKINWKCKEGHTWSAPLYSRTKGNNCPCCSNQQVCNDNNLQHLSETESDPVLKARYKFLVSEWDGTKNKKDDGEPLLPKDVVPGSNQEINWKCLNKGHTWVASLSNRTKGRNCPCCSNQQVCNDNNLQFLSETESDPVLKARYKFLVSEWDGTKNKKDDGEPLLPKDVVPGTRQFISWKCKKGHTWEAKLSSRTSGGSNCPCCSNQQVCNDNNLQYLSDNEEDLGKRERYKRLVSEWDKENNILTPEDVVPGTTKKINWKCKKEHTWEASLVSRTGVKSNCPCCSNQQVCNDNNLQYLSDNEEDLGKRERYKRLVSEWDKENNILTPEDVVPGTTKKINWKCKKEHTWEASLVSRTGVKSNCPICNESKGEEEIFKVLQNYIDSTQIKRQYQDADCRGDCRILRFDFIVEINRKKYFIEYNGKQHYKPIFSSTPEERQSNFEKAQKYDKVKLEYCRSKNIPFLVIPYTQYKNIDTIISSFLKTKTFDSKFAELEL